MAPFRPNLNMRFNEVRLERQRSAAPGPMNTQSAHTFNAGILGLDRDYGVICLAVPEIRIPPFSGMVM